MTPELQQQLILAASNVKAKAISSDVFKALVTEEIDAEDSKAVQKAAKKAVEQHPHLFKVEKPWSAGSEDEFQERERAFRESLRKSHRVGPNKFSRLDAATPRCSANAKFRAYPARELPAMIARFLDVPLPSSESS